jgi:ATP-dependent Clp protease, protease subunit
MANYRMLNRGERSAEIYIYDAIGESWDGGISARQFATDLRALGKVEVLAVRINSPGGAMFDGITIYNELSRHPARIEVDIDGLAASIASVIAMAGDEIRMADNAMLMIHDPHMMAAGTADDFRRTADLMDQAKGTLVGTYAKRTGLADDKIAALMKDETWFTAREALAAGFVDVVTGAIKVTNSFDLSQFKHVPTLLKNSGPDRPRMNLRAARLAHVLGTPQAR